jgi:serine/threonine protein kinase
LLQHPPAPQPHVTLYPVESTYAGQFEEISFLGKGGYGHVVKVISVHSTSNMKPNAFLQARNRMDGMMYAVKKIKFRDFADSVKKLDKVLREVKALAQLDHINVLRFVERNLEQRHL